MLSLDGAVELAPGLTAWTAYHEEWRRDVRCVALEAGGELVLVDPLAPPTLAAARRFWHRLDAVACAARAVHVVLTLHYHERSAAAVADRYRTRPGATVWAPTGSERRVDLVPDRLFRAGDPLPGGLEARATPRPGEAVLWLPAAGALVAGDVLLGAGPRSRFRVCPASWLPRDVRRADAAAVLRPLLELPVELLVPLHGDLVATGARDELRRALDEASGAEAVGRGG